MNAESDRLQLVSRSPEETQEIGICLGKIAEPGDLFFLTGALGSGKTCLTQGIARGLDIQGHVISPTFVLVRQYRGRHLMYHIDLYRLDSIEEIMDLALDEYLYGDGICVIEWAEKGKDVLPFEHLSVELNSISASERLITIKSHGEYYQNMIASLKK